jgi:hypothetical protein
MDHKLNNVKWLLSAVRLIDNKKAENIRFRNNPLNSIIFKLKSFPFRRSNQFYYHIFERIRWTDKSNSEASLFFWV